MIQLSHVDDIPEIDIGEPLLEATHFDRFPVQRIFKKLEEHDTWCQDPEAGQVDSSYDYTMEGDEPITEDMYSILLVIYGQQTKKHRIIRDILNKSTDKERVVELMLSYWGDRETIKKSLSLALMSDGTTSIYNEVTDITTKVTKIIYGQVVRKKALVRRVITEARRKGTVVDDILDSVAKADYDHIRSWFKLAGMI